MDAIEYLKQCGFTHFYVKNQRVSNPFGIWLSGPL